MKRNYKISNNNVKGNAVEISGSVFTSGLAIAKWEIVPPADSPLELRTATGVRSILVL
jgi:hypothetical protein